jgi:hypothetical protein
VLYFLICKKALLGRSFFAFEEAPLPGLGQMISKKLTSLLLEQQKNVFRHQRRLTFQNRQNDVRSAFLRW